MKMAEQPTEEPSEAMPTTNDDSVEKATANTDETDTTTIENIPNESEDASAAAPETVAAQETGNEKEGDRVGADGADEEPGVNTEHNASNADAENNNKTETDELKNTVEKQMEETETTDDPTQEPNCEGSEEIDKSHDSKQVREDIKSSDPGENSVQNDVEKKDISVDQTTKLSEVNEEGSHEQPKESESSDPNNHGIVTVDAIAEEDESVKDEREEEDISGLSENQVRERYEHLQTKYAASELQLNSLRDQNAELRTKLKTLEVELKNTKESSSKSSSAIELREKAQQRDGLRVQADYLAHELSQQQDTEKYLREKLAEILEEKEESERKVKDLQLRLKRFVKDDQAKDERVAKLEGELREISQEVQQLESYLDEETLQKVKKNRGSGDRSGQNGEAGGDHVRHQSSPTPQSKTCIIL